MDIGTLFNHAYEALKVEDGSLRACFKPSDTKVAHGLTYWLFETTLVYFVFKAWLPIAEVVWEHALEDVGRRPDPTIVGRAGAHEKCDLALLEGGIVKAAFEAKWWNDHSTKTWRALVEDANKLRRGFPDGQVRKYLLTFWWGKPDDWEEDWQRAKQACASCDGLQLQFCNKFDTALIGEQGYFALGLVSVDQ